MTALVLLGILLTLVYGGLAYFLVRFCGFNDRCYRQRVTDKPHK